MPTETHDKGLDAGYGEWASVLSATSRTIRNKQRKAQFAGWVAGLGATGIAVIDFAFIFVGAVDVWANPDLNWDGRFSILDVPPIVGSVLLLVGDYLQIQIANNQLEIGQFMEMRASPPVLLWSIILSVAAYVAPLIVLHYGNRFTSRAMSEARSIQDSLEVRARRRETV